MPRGLALSYLQYFLCSSRTSFQPGRRRALCLLYLTCLLYIIENYKQRKKKDILRGGAGISHGSSLLAFSMFLSLLSLGVFSTLSFHWPSPWCVRSRMASRGVMSKTRLEGRRPMWPCIWLKSSNSNSEWRRLTKHAVGHGFSAEVYKITCWTAWNCPTNPYGFSW